MSTTSSHPLISTHLHALRMFRIGQTMRSGPGVVLRLGYSVRALAYRPIINSKRATESEVEHLHTSLISILTHQRTEL